MCDVTKLRWCGGASAGAVFYDSSVATFFKSAGDFERWLAANHRKTNALLVGFHKVGSRKPSVTYREALDVALTYGWIDGVRRRVSDIAYTIRFTPRKKNSYWSKVNTLRAKDLIKQGRMKAAGLAAFNARDEEKTHRYSYERGNPVFDAATLRALKGDRKAYAYFQRLPPGMKRLYTFWIMSARREATRSKRITVVLERCRAGKRIDPFHPFRRMRTLAR
jgi:uncharacterized protein YdeI (YjbR/CyaY-like superfamily)